MAASLFFFLRRLRAPLIVLVAVYAIGIAGLVVIPGQDASGRPAAPMSLFHAFYFLSYTATTIGFGELPNPFTDTQRLWVSFVIYLSVIGWTYLIAQVLALMQDRAVIEALRVQRMRRTVSRLREPFFLLCGVGETGDRLRRALDTLGARCVAIDIDPARVAESALETLQAEVPGFVADASDPDVLLDAGLSMPQCRAVLALTSDDRANVAVAMAVRLLRPDVPVLARALTPRAVDTMRAFGTDHIVDPFATFGRYLTLAMQSPGSYRLLSWLTGLPGTTLDAETQPPRGHWIVCGYNRFGQEVIGSLQREKMSITVIDPHAEEPDEPGRLRGHGTDRAVLQAARVHEAVGIVAGTDDDVTNLAIATVAREANRSLYVILRQNLRASGPLVHAFGADIVMFASGIVAHECLAVLRTPLLVSFLDVVRMRDDAWADRVVHRLETALGAHTPELWTVSLTAREAPALDRWLRVDRGRLTLSDLSRDPNDRDATLDCVPLLVAHGAESFEMPAGERALAAGDAVLFAGTVAARHAQAQMLANANVCGYLLQGRDIPGGWVWQWWSRRGRAGPERERADPR